MNEAREALRRNLEACGFLSQAEEVTAGMYRMSWGSATVLCTAFDSAVVAVAPIFEAPPEKNTAKFCDHLLKLNAAMGGTAAFAIQHDGAVVLQCGRGIADLDPDELKLMISTVGKFADDFDDMLAKEYYA